METIKQAEMIIDKLLTACIEQQNTLQQIKLLLNSQALKCIGTFSSEIPLIGGNNLKKGNFNPMLYNDYPLNGIFIEKMDFLDKIHPRGWRLPERRDLIIQIEGKDKATITLNSVTGKLQYLRKTGKWVVGKYGNVNKYSFYFKPEWLTEHKKGIKPEFVPPMEILQGLSEEKRLEKNIIWLLKY